MFLSLGRIRAAIGVSVLVIVALVGKAPGETIPSATVRGYLNATFRNEYGGSDLYAAELFRPGSVSLDVQRENKMIPPDRGQFVGTLNLRAGKRPLIDMACSATGSLLRWAEGRAWIIYSFRVVSRDPEAPLMPVWVTLQARTEASVTAQAGYLHPSAGSTVQFRASPTHNWEYMVSVSAYHGRTSDSASFEDSRIVPVGQTGTLYVYAHGDARESPSTNRGEWNVVVDPIMSIDPTRTVLVNGVEVPAWQVYDIEMSPGFLPAYGRAFRWINAAGGSFQEATHWETFDGHASPGADADLEFASLPGGRLFSIFLEQSRTVSGISVCDADTTLELGGYSLENSGAIFIGQIGPDRGLLRIRNGTLTAAGGVKMGLSPDVPGVLEVPSGATLNTLRVWLDSNADDMPGGGSVLLTGGTLHADEVVVSGPRSVLQFDSGSLVLGNGYSRFSNGDPVVVGNGTDSATMRIISGRASFADGLTLSENSRLEFLGGSLFTASFSAAPDAAVVWSGGEWRWTTPVVLGAGQPLGANLELDGDMVLRASAGVHVEGTSRLVVAGGKLFADALTHDPGARLEFAGGEVHLAQGDISIGSQFTGLIGSTTVLLQNAADWLGTSIWSMPGAVRVDANHTLRLAGGTIQTAGLVVDGTFDYGGAAPDDPGHGVLRLYLNRGNGPVESAGSGVNDESPLPAADEPLPVRIGAGSGDAVINGRSVVKVGAAGQIWIDGAALRIDEGYALHVLERSDDSVSVSADKISLAGVLRLEQGSVAAGVLIVEPTGTLCGEGFVYAPVENGGMVSPGASPGVLDIWGDFTQTSAGKLVLEIAGPTEFDSLRVHGLARLAGELDIVLRDGYVPGPTDSFLLFDAFSIEGGFDDINVSGGDLLLDFSPSGLVVQGVPEPSALLMLAPIALLLYGCGRQCQRSSPVPGETSKRRDVGRAR